MTQATREARRLAVALVGLCLAACARPGPGADVLTQHNDGARSGATLVETALTPALVAGGAFGRLFERAVDGGVIAQPLVLHAVPTADHGRRDLLLVATETNWVYAFDLDDTSPDQATKALFARQLQPSGRVSPPICGETPSQRVGITSTPVVDAATRTLYAVARNADDHQYYLHALDLTADLRDRRPPARIAPLDRSARLDDPGAPERDVAFNADCQRNRPALLLLAGVVYVAFGSLACDRDCPGGDPYRGWVVGYRAADLTEVAVFCTDRERGHAGIWQGGAGLVGVGDRITFMTGNGPGALGDAFVALEPSPTPPGLKLAAVHQPANHAILDRTDSDLGSGGPLWLPPGLIVGGGKEGRYELLDARTLALTQDGTKDRASPPDRSEGFQAFVNSYHADPHAPACATQPRSTFPTNCDTAAVPGCYVAPARYQDGEDCGPNVNGGPVYWSAAGPGFGLVYQMAGRDFLKSFRYDTTTHHLDETPFAISTVRAVEGMSGGFSSLSAAGARDAILWVSYPLGDGQWQNVPGRLAAFDATSLRELWRDDGGYLFAKFTPPTIADGRVIRATLSGRVVVYGLQSADAAAPRSMLRRAVDRLAAAFRPRPWIPPAPIGRAAVDDKYKLAGGESGFLGKPVFDARPVQDAAAGWYRDFQGIVIGSVPSTVAARHYDARPSRAANADAPLPAPVPGRHPWLGLGTPFSSSIYWSGSTGAHIVTGEIRDRWLSGGGPLGPLGYPVADEEPAPDGDRVCRFAGGTITWSAMSGAVVHPGSR
jgi:LGFP repeat